MKLKDRLRSDSYAMGLILGFAIPIVLFAILFGGMLLLEHFNEFMLMRNPGLNHKMVPKLILVAILPSIFIMRHYLLNLKYDKTGRGILIATFVISIVFVITQFAL